MFLPWGLASSSASGSSHAGTALLTLFAIIYVFFAGGLSSTWSGVITQIKRDSSPSPKTGLEFGLLAGARGIGNVISEPLSTGSLRQGSVSGSNGLMLELGMPHNMVP